MNREYTGFEFNSDYLAFFVRTSTFLRTFVECYIPCCPLSFLTITVHLRVLFVINSEIMSFLHQFLVFVLFLRVASLHLGATGSTIGYWCFAEKPRYTYKLTYKRGRKTLFWCLLVVLKLIAVSVLRDEGYSIDSSLLRFSIRQIFVCMYFVGAYVLYCTSFPN